MTKTLSGRYGFYDEADAQFGSETFRLEYLENKHSKTVESYFSIFKRGIIGTYHHMSEAHLARYTAEFDFRYNTRKITDGECADLATKGARGKRLTYRQSGPLAA